MTELRKVPRSPLVDRFKLTSRKGPQASGRTKQILRVNDLTGDVGHDPNALLEKVQAIIEKDPTPEKVYAFAELAFLEAKKVEHRDPRLALDLYGASAVHAYQYLFDERFRPVRNPYDPGFRGACDLYNGALESALRIVCDETGLLPGQTHTIQTASGSWDINCRLQGGNWRPEDFDRFEFVSDYEIKGLKNHYQTYGLGVPLIAFRRSYPGEPRAARYYPPGLSFPVTAFLRPVPMGDQDCCDATARHRAVLELYDPLTVVDTRVADLFVPLESDLSTPMARFLSDPAIEQLATAGLLRPEKLLAMRPGRPDPIMGLYMMQPYEEGKIPVLFVHGLWSSPITWMEMYNDLTSSTAIRNRYQFWFYLYPTAPPFWDTAADLREDLAEAREVLDPYHREPALDQMVLIGHSMGGLLSRLQTIDSGDDFWRIVSDRPFSEVEADPEVRQRLARSLFFRANPSIRRVITIGTPNRGSELSTDATRWLSAKLIRLPQLLTAGLDVFRHKNRELIRDDRLLNIKNSIDSLAPSSPFFPVMLAGHHAPWVKYHNIVGLVPKGGLTGYLAAGSDGVVSYESAHMDDVQSEIQVPANHSAVHAHPRAVLEVRRILLEHLAEMDDPSFDPSGKVHTAARW
jgi:pimeloyl-ACP methyl ester carboxylesterase